MCQRLHTRWSSGSILVVAALVVCFPWSAAQGQEPYVDPVEDLRQALRVEDVRNPTDFQLEFRRKNLEEKINRLRTVGELRRALALDEWKEDPGQGRNEALRLIDEQKRREVGRRLQESLRQVLQKGAPNARLAAANMLAEMGPAVRATDVMDKGGFARSMTPEVVLLARDEDLAVRQEGLRALGTINPEHAKALAVFREALARDIPATRILAAQGLTQMVRVTNQLLKRGQTTQRVEASKDEFLSLAVEIVPICRTGLGDAEPRVRTACLEGMQSIATGLVKELISEPFQRRNFPPEGRKLTEEETKDILATYELVRGELAEITPVLKVFRENTPRIVPTLADPDPAVRLAAVDALEAIAWGRLKEKRRLVSVPLLSGNKNKLAPIPMEDPLGLFLEKGVPAIARLLKDPDVRVRRLTLDFLENLGDAAIPTVPALTEALGDRDRFVRWAAARALGELPPEKTSSAVVPLARLLLDNDGNVRMAAAASLENMGDNAGLAIQTMSQALLDGDAENRMLVMGVIGRLPAEQAKLALPQLMENLTSTDARLRKAGAETLGQLGPIAQPAIVSLRRLLGDDNSDVRTAASDAILSILVRLKQP